MLYSEGLNQCKTDSIPLVEMETEYVVFGAATPRLSTAWETGTFIHKNKKTHICLHILNTKWIMFVVDKHRWNYSTIPLHMSGYVSDSKYSYSPMYIRVYIHIYIYIQYNTTQHNTVTLFALRTYLQYSIIYWLIYIYIYIDTILHMTYNIYHTYSIYTVLHVEKNFDRSAITFLGATAEKSWRTGRCSGLAFGGACNKNRSAVPE